jgi:predicted  nucleic acid-binding Zn-ribbon protein
LGKEKHERQLAAKALEKEMEAGKTRMADMVERLKKQEEKIAGLQREGEYLQKEMERLEYASQQLK